MANALMITEELSYLAEFSFENDFADAVSDSMPQPDRISISGNHFSIKRGDSAEDLPDPLRLHFVVLGVKKPPTFTYYEGAYDGEDTSPPEWMSYDGITLDSGKLPDGVKTLAEHPAMQWGSAVSRMTGKPIMAARQHKHIVVKVMGVDGMYVLKIPPGSINKYWNPMVMKLKELSDREKASHGKATLSLATCVIEATFVPGVMGTLQFTPKGYLAGEELVKVAALHKDREAIDKMLWGPEGSARKARYEGVKPNVITLSAAPAPASVPVVSHDWIGAEGEADAEIDAKMAKTRGNFHPEQGPVISVPPKTRKAKAAPVTDVSGILQSMGIEA